MGGIRFEISIHRGGGRFHVRMNERSEADHAVVSDRRRFPDDRHRQRFGKLSFQHVGFRERTRARPLVIGDVSVGRRSQVRNGDFDRNRSGERLLQRRFPKGVL